MRGRSYSYSPSPPPRGYSRRGRSPSPRGHYGRGRDPPTSLLVRNLRRDCRSFFLSLLFLFTCFSFFELQYFYPALWFSWGSSDIQISGGKSVFLLSVMVLKLMIGGLAAKFEDI